MGDGVPSELAGELGARQRVGNAPRVDQVVGRREEFDPFEEERAPLRIEERKPLVDGDQPGIGFDLRKIRVDGAIEGDVGETEADIPAEIGVQLATIKPAIRVPRAREIRGDGGLELGHHAPLDVVNPLERPRLRQERRIGTPDIGPGVFVAGALGRPRDVDSPRLLRTAGVAQRLERNPHLDGIAEIGTSTLRLPEKVRIPVDRARDHSGASREPTLAPDPVILDTVGIAAEEVRAPMVVEGVEVDAHLIIAGDVVALGKGRSHRAGVAIVGEDAEVHRRRRIPHQYHGGILCRPTIHRPQLVEVGHSGRCAPDRFVEHPVEDNLRLDPGRPDGGCDGDGLRADARREGEQEQQWHGGFHRGEKIKGWGSGRAARPPPSMLTRHCLPAPAHQGELKWLDGVRGARALAAGGAIRIATPESDPATRHAARARGRRRARPAPRRGRPR